MENYEQAVSDCSEAIKRKKNNHIAYINRGAAYMGLGQYEQAIEDYTRAIEFKPRKDLADLAYRNRNECYQALDNSKKD